MQGLSLSPFVPILHFLKTTVWLTTIPEQYHCLGSRMYEKDFQH